MPLALDVVMRAYGLLCLATLVCLGGWARADPLAAELSELASAAIAAKDRTADSIARQDEGTTALMYLGLEHLVVRAGATRDARALPILDAIAASPAVQEIGNHTSGDTKRALIEAYVSVGKPERGIPLVRSFLSNGEPERAWGAVDLSLRYGAETREAARLLGKIRRALLKHGTVLAPEVHGELVTLWNVVSRAPSDARNVVWGSPGQVGWPTMWTKKESDAYRRIQSGSRQVGREVRRWGTAFGTAVPARR
jgi:hypothetical protein